MLFSCTSPKEDITKLNNWDYFHPMPIIVKKPGIAACTQPP
jgi:hypothetical protein